MILELGEQSVRAIPQQRKLEDKQRVDADEDSVEVVQADLHRVLVQMLAIDQSLLVGGL